jgi:hypothetical protein
MLDRVLDSSKHCVFFRMTNDVIVFSASRLIHNIVLRCVSSMVLLVSLLWQSAAYAGASLSAPSNDQDGNYTVSWSVSVSPSLQVHSGPSNGPYELWENNSLIYSGSGTSLSRSHDNGVFTYKIRRCISYTTIITYNYSSNTYVYGPASDCAETTKVVTVTKPPAAPTAATLTANTCESAQAHWVKSSDDATQFEVQLYHNASAEGSVLSLGDQPAGAPYALTNLNGDNPYSYEVRAVYSLNGYTVYSPGWRASNPIQTPQCPPGAPASLSFNGTTLVNGVNTLTAGERQ